MRTGLILDQCRRVLDQDPMLSRMPDEYYTMALETMCCKQMCVASDMVNPDDEMDGEWNFNEQVAKRKRTS